MKIKLFLFGYSLNLWLGVSFLLMVISCSTETSRNDFDRFTGRWKLDIVESQVDSLSDWEPRGGRYKNRQGFIIYDGMGGMGVHHVPEHYEQYQFEGKGGIDSLTRSDLQHLAENFVYFGKYRVDDSLQIIEHHIESAFMPKLWGTVATRKYDFRGDTLTLYPVTAGYPRMRLKWVRCNDL